MDKKTAIAKVNSRHALELLTSKNTNWSNLVSYQKTKGWWLNVAFDRFEKDLHFLLNRKDQKEFLHLLIPANSINRPKSVFRKKDDNTADIFMPADGIDYLIDTQSGGSRHIFSKYETESFSWDQTAEIAEPMGGEKLYQQRAKEALPVLVRQALGGQTITYENLANELDMPNPRNLNYVLGSVGRTLEELSQEWSSDVPPIQCLVVNKSTGLPGEGIETFIGNRTHYKELSSKQKRIAIDGELQKIFTYPKWLEALQALGLTQNRAKLPDKVSEPRGRYGGGEGAEHKALKALIANNPGILGLPGALKSGEEEHYLPSGDSIDVYFRDKGEEIGIEVKPSISDRADIARGLFQCVKYQAVLEARQAANGQAQNVRTILCLGGALPEDLTALKNVLGIWVFENASAHLDQSEHP